MNDNGNKQRELPLDAWYPYDTTGTIAFLITWAHQAFYLFLSLLIHFSFSIHGYTESIYKLYFFKYFCKIQNFQMFF